MRTSAPVDWEDFEFAVLRALQGYTVTDSGMSEDVEKALDKIRDIAPNRDPALIRAARDAFERQL